MDGGLDGWMMNRWTDGCGWMDHWMDVPKDRETDGWMDGRMDDRWTADGWMN